MRNVKSLVLLGLGLMVATYAHAQDGPDPNYDPNYDPSYNQGYQAPGYQGEPGPGYDQGYVDPGYQEPAYVGPSRLPMGLLLLLPLHVRTVWLLRPGLVC